MAAVRAILFLHPSARFHHVMTTDTAKTVFITGATGLVGGHAAEEALKRGHRVRALVRPSSDTRWLDRWGVDRIVGDLEDPDAIRAGAAGADWIFNCAAKVGDWGTLEEFRRLNVDALRLLLDAACEARIERLVHVSSLGVYEGRDHYGTDETVPPAVNSLDAYTRSKTEAESLVLEYHRARGLPAAIVRPGFIYGERDRTVLPKLITNLRRGTFAFFGSGEQRLNCIYVKNLVHAMFLAAESPAAVGEVFNVTDGEPISKKRFVGRVASL
jgi:nucleoside-diphosphate-sugar epimerase